MSEEKILVTGGAGYIGAHMVRFLLEQGLKPVVFDNLSTGFRNFVPDNVPFIRGDLRNADDVRDVFQKFPVETVMHFAARSIVPESVRCPLEYYENNVAGCINLVKLGLQSSLKYFIFSSSASVYGEPKNIPITEKENTVPTNPYGRTKLIIENFLQDMSYQGKLGYVAFRYFNAGGAHSSGEIGEKHAVETHLIPNILKVVLGEDVELNIFGDDYPTPDGTCIRDYIHVHDLCEAHFRVIRYLQDGGSGIFNLGNGNGYSVHEVVSITEKVTGKKIKVNMAPRRPGDPSKLVADYTRAREELAWEPRFKLEDIVRTAWNWEKSR